MGGLNKKRCKTLCLKSGTKKADEIHEYYMKMEDMIQEVVNEDGLIHREILALDNNEFTIEHVEEHIKEIIKQNEYNLENYNLLLKKVDEQENEIIELKRQLEAEQAKSADVTKKLQNYTGEGEVSHVTG